MNSHNLQQQYGNIDIYLFDQLLKGRYDNCQQVLDAGCGGGRNLYYFLQNGYNIYGTDINADAIQAVQQLSAQLAPHHPLSNFQVAAVEDMPFADAAFDLVICSAVLHFAQSREHFEAMLQSIIRVLKPGGFLFARLASDIGIEQLVQPTCNGRYWLPDGSERYLVNQDRLMHYTTQLGCQLYEPIKTTNVQNLRCMTTWCLQKL